jgi:hypothetical protein
MASELHSPRAMKTLLLTFAIAACACGASAPTQDTATVVSVDGTELVPTTAMFTYAFGGPFLVISDTRGYVDAARTCHSNAHLPDGNHLLIGFTDGEGTQFITPRLGTTFVFLQVAGGTTSFADPAVAGSVTIASQSGMQPLSGSYDVVLGSGAHAQGSFVAAYSDVLFCVQ